MTGLTSRHLAARSGEFIETIFMAILRCVATCTVLLRFAFLERWRVALCAHKFSMFPEQRELGLPFVSKSNFSQRAFLWGVAQLAFLRAKELPIVRALVAAITGIAALAEFELGLWVTLAASHIEVRTLERHRCICAL